MEHIHERSTSLNKGHLGGCHVSSTIGDVGSWCPCLWDLLIEITEAKSIVDVGCGAGYSLKYFMDKGIASIGIEGLPEVLHYSPVPNNIIIHDYTIGEFVLDWKCDLAWSCEFVEHVEEKYTKNFMKTFEKCNYVGMTHAVPGQGGYHHVNEQPSPYWIDVFRHHGFEYLEQESIKLRQTLDNQTYGGWVKNTFKLFRNRRA